MADGVTGANNTSATQIQSTYEKYKDMFATDTSTALDQTDFLTLMVEQLKNQDFNNPTDNTEFIAQMAQFSTLQSQQQMTYYSQASYAASLVGKTVAVSSVGTSGETTKDEGIVSSLKFNNNDFEFVVNGKTYASKNIMEVKAGSSTADNNSVQTTSSVNTALVDTLPALSGTPTFTIGFLDGKQKGQVAIQLRDGAKDKIAGYNADPNVGAALIIDIENLPAITSTSELVNRINGAVANELTTPTNPDSPLLTTTNYTAGKISITVDNSGITRANGTALTAEDLTKINQAAAKTILASIVKDNGIILS